MQTSLDRHSKPRNLIARHNAVIKLRVTHLFTRLTIFLENALGNGRGFGECVAARGRRSASSHNCIVAIGGSKFVMHQHKRIVQLELNRVRIGSKVAIGRRQALGGAGRCLGSKP
jgi:hypothetical protein